jgi:hypothetical protein
MRSTLEKPAFWMPFNLDRVVPVNIRRLTSEAAEFVLSTESSPLSGLAITKPRVVVYTEFSPENPVHELIGYGPFAVSRHLGQVARNNPDSVIGSDEMGENTYVHVFVWRDHGSVMTDIWQAEIKGGYSTSTIEVFKDIGQVDTGKYGHSGRNVVYVMGKETEFITDELDSGVDLKDAVRREDGSMPDYRDGFIVRPKLRHR